MSDDNDKLRKSGKPTKLPGGHVQLSPPVEAEEVKQASRRQSKKELDEAIKGADEVILEITTPLRLNPVTIRLDRAKITASQGKMAGPTSELVSLPITDVSHVSQESGAMFGFVKIDKEVLNQEEPFKFGPFWREDAIKMAATAEGYVIAQERKIDLAPLSVEELAEKLRKLGGG